MAWNLTLEWRGEMEEEARLHAVWDAGTPDEFKYEERVHRDITVAAAQDVLARAEAARLAVVQKKTWVDSLRATLQAIFQVSPQ